LPANGVPHAADVERLLAWLQSWPESVHRVRLHTPSTGTLVSIPRVMLINVMQTAQRAAALRITAH